jgi:hypothetical protein
VHGGAENAVTQPITDTSSHVEVKEYIKGIFKQDTATADEKYAGKLQFMIQAISETVSCMQQQFNASFLNSAPSLISMSQLHWKPLLVIGTKSLKIMSCLSLFPPIAH